MNHIRRKKLCQDDDKILLAVSGGVDSMVMLDLFVEAGYKVGVAHCNFKLRKEADQEESLVKDWCRAKDIPFHARSFKTKEHADQNKISIQVAARNLRYDFFREIRETCGYEYIATAHHSNDNLETVLINLVRGTGIDGLSGIPSKNSYIIRPMLFTSRDNILSYASSRHIKWMNDLSNDDDHYDRNLLRHKVVPILKTLNPSLEEGVVDSMRRIEGARYLHSLMLAQIREEAVSELKDTINITREKIASYEFPDVILWEIIKTYGFSFTQAGEIIKHHQSGKVFLSATHQLTVDRKDLIITQRSSGSFEPLLIRESDQRVTMGGHELYLEAVVNDGFSLSRDTNVAQMDFDNLQFPLVWRQWKHGDVFTPIGMKQRKKVSDLLIDLKVPVPEKDSVTVIESNGEIVWVVGYRLSEKVRIIDSTTKIFIIQSKQSADFHVDETHH